MNIIPVKRQIPFKQTKYFMHDSSIPRYMQTKCTFYNYIVVMSCTSMMVPLHYF